MTVFVWQYNHQTLGNNQRDCNRIITASELMKMCTKVYSFLMDYLINLLLMDSPNAQNIILRDMQIIKEHFTKIGRSDYSNQYLDREVQIISVTVQKRQLNGEYPELILMRLDYPQLDAVCPHVIVETIILILKETAKFEKDKTVNAFSWINAKLVEKVFKHVICTLRTCMFRHILKICPNCSVKSIKTKFELEDGKINDMQYVIS